MKRYCKCFHCDQVEPLEKWLVADEGQLSCAHCANKHASPPDWPSRDIRELLSFVENLDSSSPEYGLVASVFLAASLELMLEKLVVVVALGEDLLYDQIEHVLEPLLSTNQGRMRRLSLLKRLSGESFQSATKAEGFSDYPKKWDNLADVRNRSAHGSRDAAKDISAIEIVALIDESLNVFSRVNNRYSRIGIGYKAATEARTEEKERLKNWNEGGSYQPVRSFELRRLLSHDDDFGFE